MNIKVIIVLALLIVAAACLLEAYRPGILTTNDATLSRQAADWYACDLARLGHWDLRDRASPCAPKNLLKW